jgi:hypothetical protein
MEVSCHFHAPLVFKFVDKEPVLIYNEYGRAFLIAGWFDLRVDTGF